MIEVIEKSKCCGCSACMQICPKQCISMERDEEGFFYPQVNQSACIDCGLCANICHELHPFEKQKPLQVYAAINKNNDIRIKSSSGGIFSHLAENVISRYNGVVFGAKFDANWQVIIDYSETTEVLELFRGSKYVQAQVGTSYVDTERFLKEGRIVLFSGTPCQIAGLHHFLRRKYDNLLTVDVVCHGVPSPKVWDRYLSEITDNLKNTIQRIEFRDKENGWKRYSLAIDYVKQGEYVHESSWHKTNSYMQAFLKNLILRPSCYACKAKYGRSGSDITIADFWGIQQINPGMDDDKGTGLVMINTEKGAKMIDFSQILFHEEKYDDALQYNPAIEKSVVAHPNRNLFFRKLDKSKSVVRLIEKQLRPSLARRIKRRIKGLFSSRQ